MNKVSIQFPGILEIHGFRVEEDFKASWSQKTKIYRSFF